MAFELLGFCASTLPPDSGTLISNWLGTTENGPVVFLLSPGKTLLMLSPIQEELHTGNATLVAPFPGHFCVWWLLTHRLLLQSTLCEAPKGSWIGFVCSRERIVRHPCCLCASSYKSFSPMHFIISKSSFILSVSHFLNMLCGRNTKNVLIFCKGQRVVG